MLKLTKPDAGWSNITVGEFEIHISYLTDVLEDFVDIFEEFIDNGCFHYLKRPIVIRLDAEEYGNLLLIIENYETILITADDNRTIYTEWISVEDALLIFAEYFQQDMYDWVYRFELWHDDEEDGFYEKKYEEYKKRIDRVVKIFKERNCDNCKYYIDKNCTYKHHCGKGLQSFTLKTQ